MRKIRQLKNKKVLIGPSTFAAEDRTPLKLLEKQGCKISQNPYKRRLDKKELLKLLSRGIVGLIAGLEPLDREVLEKTELKVISRCGSGTSNVDLDAAEDLGIRVYSTPQAPTQAVAELTLGALLSLLRMIPMMDKDLHEAKWNKRIGTQLSGKTVVIIGFGRIGSKFASLLEPFDVRIIAVDPNLKKEDIKGIEVLPLEQAISLADIITLHPNGEKEIIGEKQFKLFKQGVFLLNAARGSLINEDSLIRALKGGTIRGLWMDTFGVEPYAGPLVKYPQVILTPHVGSYTSECRRAMEIEAVNNLISGLKACEVKGKQAAGSNRGIK